ncbi:MAG: hypothetical protein GY720_05630 [bacterium]|nr:hypothetical protein [bacterium]
MDLEQTINLRRSRLGGSADRTPSDLAVTAFRATPAWIHLSGYRAGQAAHRH